MNRALVLLLPALLAGCGSLTRLSEIGRPPGMSPITDPTQEAGYRPLSLPMPSPHIAEPQANALWRNGSRAFFKDQRAANVGDLLTVLVSVKDSAVLQNETSANRTSTQSFGLPSFFGLETAAIPHMLTGAAAASLLNGNGGTGNKGTGDMKRNETIQLRLAGVVTQALPNGNLVIAARQEMRVNNELRELQVSGVIRPQDIASDNTVLHDRMAEARIAYGGRGQLMDVQSPRWGQQLMDIVLPF